MSNKLLLRYYQDLKRYLQPNKVLVIYGPRQVGKTTLLKNSLDKLGLKYKLDVGENIRTQEVLGSGDFTKIKDYVSGYQLIVIDEAQRIPDIGQGLKIIVDQVPGIKVIATGSSSFDLSGQVGEPLTGRKRTLILYPLAQMELKKDYNRHELQDNLNKWLVFGSYPAVETAKSVGQKKIILQEITDSYLLKDILEMESVKGSKVVLDLLRLISFQIGQEVSLTELGTQLGIDYKTVGRYLDLLEKSFVLYNLRGFSRNLRKEITKKSKYYFYDNGIRNAIIANFNELNLRDDVGRLWENFLVAERLKKQQYKQIFANNYFWRTWEKQEIDWVEERGGRLYGFEFKYTSQPKSAPPDWRLTYQQASYKVINKTNYLSFIT